MKRDLVKVNEEVVEKEEGERGGRGRSIDMTRPRFLFRVGILCVIGK